MPSSDRRIDSQTNVIIEMADNFSLVRRISQVATRLGTLLTGVSEGTDEFGNHYYRGRRTPKGLRERRWVIYKGEPEASKVPAEWHIWLHHTEDRPISNATRKPWQLPHQQNLTGTPDAYLPPGHTLEGGVRPKATGDYEAWQPEN